MRRFDTKGVCYRYRLRIGPRRRSVAVAKAWESFDLRRHLEANWARVGPDLRGKIRIWMGDADTYFLDGATRMLEEFLKSAKPPAEARIEFAAGKRHGWEPRTWTERLREMEAAVEGRPLNLRSDR